MSYVTSTRRSLRRGAMVLHMALCMTVLIGIMAIALDGGVLLAERRHAQATADAAAMAGAADLLKNYLNNNGIDSGSAATSAITTAAANGYTGANSPVTVRVNPANYLGGPNAGTQVPPGYIEVTVTHNQARFFSSIWGSSDIPISARAVARGKWSAVRPAILVLAPSGTGININGNGSVQVSGAGDILVNSTSTSSITTSGSNANVLNTSGTIFVAGPGPASNYGNVSPAPVVNQPPLPDPLRFLPEPSQPANAPASTTNANGDTVFYPGYYASSPNLQNGNNILQPGIYYINGAFSPTGNQSLTGTGVMLFLDANASLKLAGGGSVNLSPPTSGIYQGLTIFQSRSNSSKLSISGNGNMNISGTIYAPSATVSLQGNGDTIGSQIIAKTVSGGGNGATNIGYNSSSVAFTRLLNLVE